MKNSTHSATGHQQLVYFSVSFMLALFFSLCAIKASAAQESVKVDTNAQQNFNSILEQGESARQISLQQELFAILTQDSNEVQKQYKEEGLFYKSKELETYEDIIAYICEDDNAPDCPEVFFTLKENSGPASMYPNAVLAISEAMFATLTRQEQTFILAHEYAHLKYQHSAQRAKKIAQHIVEEGVMIREPENALVAASFMPAIRLAHHEYEAQADNFATAYLNKIGYSINCKQLFHKLVAQSPEVNDKHASSDKRCADYDKAALLQLQP